MAEVLDSDARPVGDPKRDRLARLHVVDASTVPDRRESVGWGDVVEVLHSVVHFRFLLKLGNSSVNPTAAKETIAARMRARAVVT
jgi:hypothetical protein